MTIELDATSRLATLDVRLTLGELEAQLRVRGYTLPVSACAPRDRSLSDTLREPYGCEATPAWGELIEQCVAIEGELAGNAVALAPAPRRAIGPDVLRLFLQNGQGARTVTLRVHGAFELVRTIGVSCAEPFSLAAQLFARDLLPADMWWSNGVLAIRLAGKRQIVAAQENAIRTLVPALVAPLAPPPITARGLTISLSSPRPAQAAAGFTPFGVTLFGDAVANETSALWRELSAHIGAAHGS